MDETDPLSDLTDRLRSVWTRVRSWFERATRDRSPSRSLWDRDGEIGRKLNNPEHPLER